MKEECYQDYILQSYASRFEQLKKKSEIRPLTLNLSFNITVTCNRAGTFGYFYPRVRTSFLGFEKQFKSSKVNKKFTLSLSNMKQILYYIKRISTPINLTRTC